MVFRVGDDDPEILWGSCGPLSSPRVRCLGRYDLLAGTPH